MNYKIFFIYCILLFYNISLSAGIYRSINSLNNEDLFLSNPSPDGNFVAVSNSNYTSLHIASDSKIIKVPIPTINSFHCKWSPDSKYLLVKRSSYENKRRRDGLIVIDVNGSVSKVIVEETLDNIIPLGWTGANTIHYLLNNSLFTLNVKNKDFEWDSSLLYSIDNKLYEKADNKEPQLLYEAKAMILNLDYSADKNLIAFEVYGHKTIIIKNRVTILDEINFGNAPKVSPDGSKIVYMSLEDDGHNLTSGSIYLWKENSDKTEPLIVMSDIILMNPAWISADTIIYYNQTENAFDTFIIR